MISGSCPWTPQSKERPRHNRWGTYTPARTATAEADIVRRLYELGLVPPTPLADPLRVHVFFGAEAFWFEIEPVTEASEKGMYRDADNMGKLVTDAFNGVMYEDDRQIVDLRLVKM